MRKKRIHSEINNTSLIIPIDSSNFNIDWKITCLTSKRCSNLIDSDYHLPLEFKKLKQIFANREKSYKYENKGFMISPEDRD